MGAFALTLIFLTSGNFALAQSTDTPIPSPDEYQNSCASCHGPKGEGDGPMALFLTVKPTDLSKLAERNQGNFRLKESCE